MKRVLITGAGGFIGGRLVEILSEKTDVVIHVLLRNLAKGARVSRYPVHFFKGNIIDKIALNKAMTGCDTVVHCAHDFSDPDSNLRAADLIAGQCLQLGIQKLVYISSFSVHKNNSGSVIHEQSPLNEKWDYAVIKTEVERRLLDHYTRSALPVVIIRPTVVYGPFSTAWTTNTVTQMLGGRVIVPYFGERICNAVYVDDVVNAVICALQSATSHHGKVYLVSGPETISWMEYYRSFLPVTGTSEPVFLNEQESATFYKKLSERREGLLSPDLFSDPITYLKKTPVYLLYQRLLKRPAFKNKLLKAKTSMPRPLIYPSKDLFETLSCTGRVDTSRLINELGFTPGVSFSDGMKKTLAWVEWANLNCE